MFFGYVSKAYCDRKKQRIQKKISTQLNEHLERSTHRAEEDLNEILDTLNSQTNQRSKGSRFTHTGKLQFKQVTVMCVDPLWVGVGCIKNRKWVVWCWSCANV